MSKMLLALQGKKTYLTALAMILYAMLGLYLKQLTLQQAIELVLASGAVASLRDAIAKQ